MIKTRRIIVYINITMNFKDYMENEDDPVLRWKAMRQGVFNNTTQRENEPNQRQISKPEDLNIPGVVMDAITTGFETGSVVSPLVMRYLKLNDENRSLVGDSTLTSGNAYPFIREKLRGQHTGLIRFVRGFPIVRFLSKLKDLITSRKN